VLRHRAASLSMIGLALFISTCGGHATSPAPIAGCISPGSGVTSLELTAADGERFEAVIQGAGNTGIVLSNQSDEDLCKWRALAGQLATKHYMVVLFNYGSGQPFDEIAAAAEKLRALRADKVFLIGASKGAKSSIIAATQIKPPVAGVVSISAERLLQRTDVMQFAARLTVPILFVTSEADPYGSVDASRSFYENSPSQDKQIVTVPGADHGVALVANDSHPDVVAKIVGFLQMH
jgi:serine aminopeptidase S33 family